MRVRGDDVDFDSYRRHDAAGLAELVRKGEVTAAELRACAQRRLEAVNPTINAVVRRLERDTEEPHGERSGSFHGVPFLLKDLVQDVAGEPTSRGSRAYQGTPADVDATYTRRVRAAGMTLLGKTNTPELGLKAVTENRLFGATRNPWDTSRTPGGSSGGSAAAVSAGIVPMAGGNDGGGSIRIPASYCGLFGLRPSRGRVPAGPAVAEVWEGASSDHVLTRSVRDSAAMLDVLRGADTGAPFEIAAPSGPYALAAHEPPGTLRIALCTESPVGGSVHPECREAAEGAARLLESLGHELEPVTWPVDGMALADSFFKLYFGQVAAMARERRSRDFELDTRVLAMLGRSLNSAEYVAARERWNDFSRRMGQFFQRFDVFLTPTVAALPALIGETDTPALERLLVRPFLWLRAGRLLMKAGVVEQLAFRSLRRTPFTQLANLTGSPAMSVPLHWTADGLPLGSHFQARFGDETTLFQLAAQLEQARPWFDRVAPL